MAIALAISGKPPLEVDAELITIGSDPSSIVALTGDDRIKPRHAVIRRVAGRWLVEVREGESIQVGDSEPARLHWLNPGDVIRLVENGPEITFQPPGAKSAANAAPSIPLATAPAPTRQAETGSPAPERDSLFEPLTAPVSPPAAPAWGASPPPSRVERIAPIAQSDSLFEPLATPDPPPPAVRRTPASNPPRKAESRKRRGGDSLPDRVRTPQTDDDDDQETPESIPLRAQGPPLPKLRSDEAGLPRSDTASQTTVGWITIWVAIGLGVIAVVACIWFGSGPASGNDYLPNSSAHGGL